MYSLLIPDMTILQEENTRGVSFIAGTFANNEILTGHFNGNIHLWRFLDTVCSYFDDRVPIVYICALNQSEFLSVNSMGVIKIWDKGNRFIKKKISLSWHRPPWLKPDYFVMLPDNLLAFSKYFRPRSLTVEVWDVRRGTCVHRGFHTVFNVRGMPLDITTAGYLVVSSIFGTEMRIWNINKRTRTLVCKTAIDPIFSLAALPTNEIVTAARNIVIYKLTLSGEIYKTKVIEHKNIIDLIIPVAGYKFLTVDRAKNHSGILKLWYSSSGQFDYLGHSRNTGTPRFISTWYNLIFTYAENKLFIKHYDSDKFRFSRKLAEIRKNVRILAQAERTSSSLFITLPVEIQIKIAIMTAQDMNEHEKRVSKDFAWSHFCKPNLGSTFIKNKDVLYNHIKRRFKNGRVF